MQRRLLDVLQCSVCSATILQLQTAETGDDIQDGMIVCERCGKHMPIQDGIVDALGSDPVPLTAAQITNYAPPAAWAYERLWRWQSLSLLTNEHFPLQRELRLVQLYLTPERTGVLIDVACSAALYARSWATVAPRDSLLIAVDHSWAMLYEARRQTEHARRPIALIRAAAQALPIRTGSATGVGMGGSLNEIGDATTALREVRRVLTDDGHFVTMNLIAARSKWGQLLQRGLATGGIAFPTLNRLNRQLEQAGLRRQAQWQWQVVTVTAARAVTEV